MNLAKGLGLTFKKMLEPKYTMQYPDERWHLTPTFRGMPALLSDPETGRLKCTACGICERTCAVEAIKLETVVGENRRKQLTGYRVDMARCIACGLCAESCPFEALTMAGNYELAGYTREQLVYNLDELAEIGKAYTENNQKPLPQSVFSAYFAEGGFCYLKNDKAQQSAGKIRTRFGRRGQVNEVSQR
ncbi:MAG: NADH-quinone oxidoreductase subunit I [Firmicutes bacterium]|nr:NADH-quinone oxidoreductase subunit I [Bacillota bacterium]